MPTNLLLEVPLAPCICGNLLAPLQLCVGCLELLLLQLLGVLDFVLNVLHLLSPLHLHLLAPLQGLSALLCCCLG